MAEVTYLEQYTTMPVPVERVLDGARGCAAVLVLGALPDGTLYAAASEPDAAQLLWWVEQFKYKVLAGEYG